MILAGAPSKSLPSFSRKTENARPYVGVHTPGRSYELIVQPGNTVIGDVSTAALLKIPAYLSGVRFLSEAIAPLHKRVLDAKKNEHREHPAYRLLNTRPSNRAGAVITHQTHIVHAATYGNGYALIKRDAAGTPIEYVNREPERLTAFHVDDTKWVYLHDENRVASADDVVHLMGISYDGVIGQNPKYLLCDTIDLARVLVRYQLKYFKNGSFINGVITAPAGTTDPQFKAAVNAFRAAHNGESGGQSAWLLPGFEWKSTTSDNNETQFKDLRQLSDIDIARVLRIHPSIIYAQTNGTLAGLESSIIKSSVRTWVEQLEDEWTNKMLTTAQLDAGWHIKFDQNELMRGDPKWGAMLWGGVNAGVILPNEWREYMDLPPVDGGDVLRMPVNVAQPQDVSSLLDDQTTKKDDE